MHKMLKPAMGKDGKSLKVHNPATKLFLKESGQMVAFTTYWRRRLACGDVVEAVEKKEVKKEVAKKATKNKKDMEVES